MRSPIVVTALLFVGVLAGAGCPNDACLEEVAYGGLGNDEVWLTLKDAKARATTGDDAATITAPTGGQTFAVADGPPDIAWESPLKISTSMSTPLLRPRPRSWLDVATAIVIPSARAHLPPVSSDAYLVEIAVPGRECPVTVVTTALTHTLDAEAWSALADAAGADLTMEITSAYLAQGAISEGPFAAAPVTFKVE